MALNQQIWLEMLGRPLSSNTSDVTFERTQMQLTDTEYDGAVYYPEVVALNNDGSDRTVKIVNAGGTEKATVTIPASTAALTRIRGVSFTPDSGATIYRIKVEGTTSSDQIEVHSAGILVEQTGATKATFQFPMIWSGSQTATNSDLAGSVYASNPTSWATHEGTLAHKWKKDEDKFATIADWRLEGVLAGTTGVNNARARLYNQTDGAAVDSVQTVSTSVTLVSTTISNAAANFDDLDNYQIEWSTSNAGNQVQLYAVRLYLRCTDLTKSECWLPVEKSRGFHSDVDQPQNRKLYDASKFGASAAYFHVSGYGEGAAVGSAILRDHGTNDSGITAPTTISTITINSAHTYSRSADILSSLTSGNRYIFRGEWDSGGALEDVEITGAWLVLSMTPIQGPALEESFSWIESPQTELYDFLSYSPSPDTAFDWTASPFSNVWPFVSPTEMTADLAFTESPRAALFSFLSPSPLEEDFSFGASPLEYELGAYYGPGALVLAEVWLDAGTEYHSSLYVRHPTRVYQGRVVSFGTVDRSLPVPSGFPEVGDARIELADTDNKFRALFSVKTPRRRLLVLKMGQEGGSESLFQVVYTGEIKQCVFPAGKAIVIARDITFQFFEELIPKLITADNFNLTEEESEAFSPIIFGQVFSAGLNDQGAWDCPRLSSTRYNVARHPMASVQVYRKLPLAETFTLVSPASYSINEEIKTIDGVEYTFSHIDFRSPQDDGTLVRADGEGRLDEASPPALERNPANCIKDFLLNIAHRPWADLNHIAFSDLEVELDTLGYLCDGVITSQMTYREALSRMIKSFNLDFYQDKDGRISIDLVTGSDPNRPVYDDTLLLERDSVEQRLAEPFANKLRYNYNRVANEWYTELIYNNEIDQTALGEEEEKTIDLWFVRDPSTANAVIADYSSYLDLASHRIEFRVPTPRTLHMMELAKLVGVTHYAGLDPGGAGFTNREFKITGISHDLNALKTTIKAVRRNPLAEQKSLLTGYWTTNAIVGPWMGPAPGIFYVVLSEDFSGNTLKVMRSLDWGATWTWLETPTTTNNIGSHDTKTQGIFLHLAIQEDTTGRVSYWKYNMASESWEVQNETIVASVSPLGIRAVSIDVRTSGDDVITAVPIVFHQTNQENVGGTDYNRVTAWRRTGVGSWTSIAVGRSGVAFDSRICRVVCAGSRVHFFFGENHGVGLGLRNEYHQTMRANNSLGSATRWLVGNSTYFGALVQHNMGKPAVSDSGLTIPFKGWWGEPYMAGFASDNDLVSNPVKTLISGTAVFQGAGAAGLANYPAACLDYIGSELQIVFAHFTGFNRWEVHKTGAGPTPGPTGATAAANQCGPRVPWPTNEPQMTNALTFRYGTSNWIAKVFSVGSGTIGFELVSVSELPRATTYTISDFLAEAT